MKTIQAILVFGGMILFTTIAISGTAHACGGDKEVKHNQTAPKDLKAQAETSEMKKVAVQKDEVYGPPAPSTDLGLAMKLSQSGSR